MSDRTSGAALAAVALPPLAALRGQIADRRYVFMRGSELRPLVESIGVLSDWEQFRASWDDLPLDTYMADRGRYRRRRHAAYTFAADGSLARAPHQPHYQSPDYNPLNGGIERWFAPIDAQLGSGASMTGLLRSGYELFGPLARRAGHWRVEAHQFRIEARPGEAARPTPEGVHRDGVDYVLVLLVRRHNIAQGTTSIHTPQGALLGSFTLTAPFDAALIDDHCVAHGVTPVEPIDPAQPAFRDVLVLTYTHVQTGGPV